MADAREMAAVPHCAAQPTSFELGVLEYGQAWEAGLTLTNTAQVIVRFKCDKHGTITLLLLKSCELVMWVGGRAGRRLEGALPFGEVMAG